MQLVLNVVFNFILCGMTVAEHPVKVLMNATFYKSRDTCIKKIGNTNSVGIWYYFIVPHDYIKSCHFNWIFFKQSYSKPIICIVFIAILNKDVDINTLSINNISTEYRQANLIK